MESIAAELASSFIESSLGFDSEQTKLQCLQQIRQSLEESSSSSYSSCNNNNSRSNSTTTAAQQSWIDLMEGTHDENVMLRDTFIKSLLENCHPNESCNDNNINDEEEEIVFDLIDMAFACLALSIKSNVVVKT